MDFYVLASVHENLMVIMNDTAQIMEGREELRRKQEAERLLDEVSGQYRLQIDVEWGLAMTPRRRRGSG